MCSPIVLVRKSDGTWRFCVDLRLVNRITKKQHWPLPRLEEMLAHLVGTSCYATFDLLKGFWQFPLSEPSCKYVAFATHAGQYEFTRVVMGAQNSSSHFQSVMHEVLYELIYAALLVFLDDILVFGGSEEELLDRIDAMLALLAAVNIKLKPQKCELFAKQLVWCGREISAAGVGIAPTFQHTLLEMATPTTAADLQQLIAAANWVRGMLPNFARIIEPLQDLLTVSLHGLKRKNKAAGARIRLLDKGWGQQHDDAFRDLKATVAHAVTNAHPDDDKEMCLWTDASSTGWGAVLTQVSTEEYNDPLLTWAEWKHEPLAFLSGVFRGSSARWAIPDKEAYSIWASCKRLTHFLVRRKGFHIFTDHRNLTYIFDPLGRSPNLGRPAADRLQRWSLTLRAFDFDIVHMPGESNHWPDLLSRWGNPAAAELQAEAEQLRLGVMRVRRDRVLPGPAHDMRRAIGASDQRTPPEEEWPTLREVARAQAAEVHRSPMPLRYEEERKVWVNDVGAVYVPDGEHRLRERLMVIAHCGAAGHRGARNTQALLEAAFCWPSLAADLEEFLHLCLLCVKLRGGEVAPIPWGRVVRGLRPGDSLHMDYLTLSGLADDEAHGLLVLKCGHSLFCRLYMCACFNAENAENALLNWAADFGLPSVLVTDGGSHFKNQLIEALMRRMRTTHHITAPYAAWANGIVERLNRVIVELLRVLLAESLTPAAEWRPLLPLVQSLINQQISAQTLAGLTPSKVFLNRELPRPLDTVTGAFMTAAGWDKVPQGPEIRRATEAAAKEMHSNWLLVNAAQEKRAEQNRAQRAHTAKPVDYQVGDYVLVRAMLPRNKLRFKWLGPWRVVGTVNPRVWVVEDIVTLKRDSVHGQRMKYYADKTLNVTEDLKNQISYDDRHYVEKVVNWRVDDADALQLRVRWVGFTAAEDSWEEANRLHDDVPVVVERYLRTIAEACPGHVPALLAQWKQAAAQAAAGKASSGTRRKKGGGSTAPEAAASEPAAAAVSTPARPVRPAAAVTAPVLSPRRYPRRASRQVRRAGQ